MRKHWIRKGVKFALIAVLFVAIFGFGVKLLWNWLMPSLFGWQPISFAKALGILVLSKILFGGFRGGGGRHGMHGGWRHRMSERWENMTPDEREKFQQGMRGRCGGGPFRQPSPPAEHPV